MKIAVIGAGWAGAACAWQLEQDGHQVIVFDSAPQAGGRARQVQAPWGPIDNGQHLLLGAYQHTLDIMRRLGLDPEARFFRFELDIVQLDERFRLRYWPLPEPWHQLGVLLGSTGLNLQDRLALRRCLKWLEKTNWQPPAQDTVDDLMRQSRQTPKLVEKLWRPLCIAALNTPLATASAQIFAAVLRDSLGAGRRHTQMLIPRHSLSDLWVNTALDTVDCRFGHPVRSLQLHEHGLSIDKEHFDVAVLATQIPSALRLLKPWAMHPNQKKVINQLESIRFNPISTVYLQPERPWAFSRPMTMLVDEPNSPKAGQWLFNHAAIPGSFAGHSLAVVISDSAHLKGYDKATILRAIEAQIRNQLPAGVPSLPRIVDSLLITEQRATFMAVPGLQRPIAHSPWPDIYFAADWVDGPYPAVLEAAVHSGLETARQIHQHSLKA